MIFSNWLCLINFLENTRTIMAMVGISLVLSSASLLLLVVSYCRLIFKSVANDSLNPPKFPTTL